MADLDFNIEVSGVEQTFERLEQDFKDGIEDGIDDLLDLAEREAQNVVRLHDRIFNREVYHGFRQNEANWTSPTSAEGSVRNVAPHAPIVEYGADYGARGPPVEALIPWVERNLGGWQIMDDGPPGGPGPKTPHAGDDSGDDLDSHVDANWTQFHNDRYDGEGLWEGQRVTVYDPDDGYVNGTIKTVTWRGHTEIDRDDGLTDTIDWRGGTHTDGYGIAAGQDWYSLSSVEKKDIMRSMAQNMDFDSTFTSGFRSDIDDVLEQYIANAKNPAKVKRMLMGISKIKRNDSISALGNWIGDERSGSVTFNEQKAGIGTIRHEFGHAFINLNGYDYAPGARHYDDTQGERWDTVRRWKNGSLPYNYDSIGEENWETESGNPLPHPTTYMLHHRDKRAGNGIYDDVNDPSWDNYREYVHKQSKFDLQRNDDNSPPDYDPFFTEQQVLDPDSGAAGSGDAMHIAYENDGAFKDFHVEIESSVYKKSNESGYALDISQDGTQKTLDITDNGELADDNLVFYGYLMGGADELNGGDGTVLGPDDVPTDPGFYADADDTMERLREGLNRHLWREMLATELGDRSQRGSWYLRSDGYSGTNAHETMAHFMAIILSDGQTSGADRHRIQNLLDRSPLLIYAGAQVFDYSDEMKDALEQHTGLDFDDLLYDIWREYVA